MSSDYLQVMTLKDQLEQEIRKRQVYVAHRNGSRQPDEEHEITKDNGVGVRGSDHHLMDLLLVEHVSNKDLLDELNASKSAARHLSPTRGLSPTRFGRPVERSSPGSNRIPMRSTTRK